MTLPPNLILRPAFWGGAIALGLMLLAAALALGFGTPARDGAPQSAIAPASATAKPPSPPPPPPPAELAPVGPDAARAANAVVPFTGPGDAAPRFRFVGSDIDRARALDCLAIAMIDEAGAGDDPGQRAVAQVILNRVRHPAFPKTVCGVIFQGSERVTGCQFTFTCDGALSRGVAPAALATARLRANEALGGRVEAGVGTATHYHTDWVRPVWSGQLVKLSAVGTHLFFRWPGFWGSRASLRDVYRGGEPLIGKIAFLPAHAAAPPEPALAGPPPDAASPTAAPAAQGLARADGVIKHPEGGAFLMVVAAAATPDALVAVARRLCAGQGYCHVMGWIDPAERPRAFPIPRESRRQQNFDFVSDIGGSELAQFDCRAFRGVNDARCLPGKRVGSGTPRVDPAPSQP